MPPPKPKSSPNNTTTNNKTTTKSQPSTTTTTTQPIRADTKNTFPILQLKRRFTDVGIPVDRASEYAKTLFEEGCNTMKLLGMLLDTDLLDFGIRPEHRTQVLGASKKESLFWRRIDLIRSFDIALMKSKLLMIGLSDQVSTGYAKLMVEKGCNNHRLYCQLTEGDLKQFGITLPNHILLILDDAAKERSRKPQRTPTLATFNQLNGGHSSFVLCVTYNRDGTDAYTGGYDKRIIAWDLTKGEMVGELIGHTGPVYDISIAPNQKWVATASGDSTVRLWNTQSDGEEQDFVFRNHIAPVYTVTFFPSSDKLVSGSVDKSIIVWDVIKGAVLHQIMNAHTDFISRTLIITHSNMLVTTSHDTSIKIWNIDTFSELFCLKNGHTHRIFTVAYDDKNELLITGGEDRSIVAWSIESGKVKNKAQDSHIDCVLSLDCFNSYLLSGGGNGQVKIWELPSFELLKTISAHAWWVYGVKFLLYESSTNNQESEKLKWISCGDDKIAKIWYFDV
jgi:WD40 repeat protein